MFRSILVLFLASLYPGQLALAQETSTEADVVRMGPGVTFPKVIYKIEPEYTQEARDANIQGNVMFEIVIDEHGKPTGISLLSPLGFGLDERARQAIETWTFVPGRKDGKPVKILANVEVAFRFPEIWFDSKMERRRTAFNLAISKLERNNAKSKAEAAKSLQELADQKFPAALYVVGELYETGDVLTKDPDRSLALITKAADKNYGPAMYKLGIKHVKGDQVPQDVSKGMHLIREAAVTGSIPAQFFLGKRYETGNGVARDADAARRYFRLCATAGEPRCQFELAKLLLEEPNRTDRRYIQAISWLQLASDSQQDARMLLETEITRATPDQIRWANKLKPQLLRKPYVD
jgi:TonB family protein